MDIEKNYPMKISLMKTAYYTIVYPVKMGYVLSGENSRRELHKIEDFGIPLGIAFQVRDDLLGAFGVEDETGKPSDSDILEGKLTLLIQNTLARLEGTKRQDFMDQILSQEKSSSDVELIRSRIRDTGAFDETIDMHGELIEASLRGLDNMIIGRKSREILMGVIESIDELPALE